MFFQHGAQKLFGVFGGNTVEIFSLFGLAGVIEFFGGIDKTFTKSPYPILVIFNLYGVKTEELMN